ARPVGIGVRGVEEVEAELEGAADEGPALLLVERPRMSAPLRHAEAHASQAEPGDVEPRAAELDVVHGPSISRRRLQCPPMPSRFRFAMIRALALVLGLSVAAFPATAPAPA